jgi:hypothetical protein
MAMNQDDLVSVEEPILRQITPRPFESETLDPKNVFVSYDRDSDTLILDLFGQGRSSISVPVNEYLYAMVDPRTEMIIGGQIEHFLSHAVKDQPEMSVFLSVAERRGITPLQVFRVLWKALGLRKAISTMMQVTLARNAPGHIVQPVSSLLVAEADRWGLPTPI